MSQFLRVTMLLGSVTLINLLVQIVRTKIVALHVGKAGMAVIAQMADWQALLATYVLLGTEQGLVALSADAWAQGSYASIHRLLRLVRRKVAPMVAVVLLVLALASPWLMPALSGLNSTVWAGAAGTLSLLLQLWVRPRQSVLNGAKAFGLVARSRLIESLTAVAMVIPLVLAFGLPGALWSLAAVHVSSLIGTAWVWRQFALPAAVDAPPASADADATDMRTLRQFAGALLISGGAASLLGLLLRRRIIDLLGLEQAGLYQVAYALTLQYLGLVLGAMSAYSFPSYRTASQQPGQLGVEVNQTLRSVLLLVTPIIIGLLTARELLIWLLFSREYVGAADLLQIQLVGDLFKVVAWATGLTVLASGRVRLHVLLDLGFYVTWMVLVEVLTRSLGRYGPPTAFLANQILMCAVYAWVNRRAFAITPQRDNIALLTVSALAVGAAAWLGLAALPLRLAGSAVVMAGWALLSVRRSEASAARQWLQGRLARFR